MPRPCVPNGPGKHAKSAYFLGQSAYFARVLLLLSVVVTYSPGIETIFKHAGDPAGSCCRCALEKEGLHSDGGRRWFMPKTVHGVSDSHSAAGFFPETCGFTSDGK